MKSFNTILTKRNIILVAVVLVKFVLQYNLISSAYDLQRDEFLHLDQGNHLAWGFLSVPPVTSWISYIIHLLGNTEFWVKFFPALFGALTIIIVWKTIEELGGNLKALLLGASGVLFSALLSLNILYQPNSLDVLIWTTFYFVLIKYFNSKNSKWLYIAAITFAFGFLNKYNIIFLLIGLFPAILLTEQRSLFKEKKIYFALGLGFLLILPNLWWQYQNNFPVFHHLKQLADLQLVHVNRWYFFKSQLLFFFGSLLVIISALYGLIGYKPFKQYQLFFWSMFFTLGVFTWFKAKDYYAIGLYPIYIAFGSVFLVETFKTGWKKSIPSILIAVPVLTFIPMYQIAFPNRSPEYIVNHSVPNKTLGLHRWEDGKDHALPQDYADMLGWKELASKVDSICATLPNLDQTLILCDNYGQAGAINFYSKNEKVIASSFHADYIDWFNVNQKIVDVVLVKEMDDEDKNRKEETPLFDSVYLASKRINSYAREEEILIYVLRGAKVDIMKRILAERAERKKF